VSTSATATSPTASACTATANVAVLRTFSKAYGLAGLRIGFLIGHQPVAEAVRKTMLPFTVSSVAQGRRRRSLGAEDELLDRVETVVKERDRVRQRSSGTVGPFR